MSNPLVTIIFYSAKHHSEFKSKLADGYICFRRVTKMWIHAMFLYFPVKMTNKNKSSILSVISPWWFIVSKNGILKAEPTYITDLCHIYYI